MRHRLSLFLVLALAACGNWSDEDVEFLLAIPAREQLALRPPDEAQAGKRTDALSDEDRTIYENVTATARGINALVTGLTHGLDQVRALEPSRREPGLRLWGPFPDKEKPGWELQIAIRRHDLASGGADYVYEVGFRREGEGGEFAVVLRGVFHGERAENGSGELHYLHETARGLGLPGDAKGDIDLTWDRSSGLTEAALDLDGEGGTHARIEYRAEPDGGGWMAYRYDLNLAKATAALERLEVLARWRGDGSGRAEVRVTEGDLGAAEGKYTECWNTAQERVYTWRNFDCGFLVPCERGNAALCSVPDAR